VRFVASSDHAQGPAFLLKSENVSITKSQASDARRNQKPPERGNAETMIKEQLMQDLKVAMRDKDALRKDMIQIVRAAVLQVEKDSLSQLDDEGVFGLIAKEVKKREELLGDLKNSDRIDIIDRTKVEMAILNAYLPEQMSEEQVEAIVRKIIGETGARSARDMGQVMKSLIPEVRGRADGKMVSQVVKRLLA
jgi:uncharacterized protein YqeY